DPFYGKDSEDAQEWIEMFLKVKETNGWPDNRRVAIATEMLKKEAADWYNLVNTTINRWDRDANTGFRERFLACFSSQEKLHRWQYELMNLKQINKKVETYASRFKKLANRVDAGGIPDAFKVRMFLSGLNKELATLVAIQNSANLDAAIT
ncbi:14417_t:CDS:1, partial [Funneliformis mosseae]